MKPLRMCRYCGRRIVEPRDRCGRLNPEGPYCRAACADAVAGFDLRLAREASEHNLVPFDPLRHERVDPAGAQPEPPDKAFDAQAEILSSGLVDFRLPSILTAICHGFSRRDVARQAHLSCQMVSRLLRRLRLSRTNATR